MRFPSPISQRRDDRIGRGALADGEDFGDGDEAHVKDTLDKAKTTARLFGTKVAYGLVWRAHELRSEIPGTTGHLVVILNIRQK